MMLEALGTGGGPVSLELALAVLLHDIGKPACREVDETGRIRFPVMTRKVLFWPVSFCGD